MKPKLLLRRAAFFVGLHLIGHSIGALTWKQPPNAAIGRVINSMQTQHFDFMGRSVTLGNFYSGYGFTMLFVLGLLVVLFWQLSNNAENRMTTKLLLPLSTYLLIQGVLEFIYFFPFAAIISLLAAISGFAALMTIRSLKPGTI